MILGDFLKALGQLGDPRFRAVLLKGVGLPLPRSSRSRCSSSGESAGSSATASRSRWIGTVGWIDNVASWAMVPLMLVLSVFLMVPVASAITSVFLDDVAQAVEDRHYPRLGTASPVPLAVALQDTLGFFGLLIGANIAALVIYLFFVPFAPFIFWALNGFLLGREYFTLAAMRRVGRPEARRLWRRHLPTIWIAGVLMALPLSVPLLNLLVPVIGAATFTHLFHRLSPR